jgi:hypothetical protein
MGVPRLLTDMGTPAVYLLRRDLPRANSVDLLSLHRRLASRRVPPRRYRFSDLVFVLICGLVIAACPPYSMSLECGIPQLAPGVTLSHEGQDNYTSFCQQYQRFLTYERDHRGWTQR